jgi:hypothetical protein
MKVLNCQKARAVEVIQATNHEMIDRETAVFLNRVEKLDLEFDEKEIRWICVRRWKIIIARWKLQEQSNL